MTRRASTPTRRRRPGDRVDGPPTRRHVLAAVGVAGGSALAGCLSDPEPEASATEDRIPYSAAAVAIDDHPLSEPLRFSGENSCPVCTMTPADYLPWSCQLAHADGTGLFFESPGCLLAYRAVTRAHPTDAPIERIWFIDQDTREMFDAADGFLVKETALESQASPMSGSPVPFATEERAMAYVDDADHLDADDVLTIDDVDRELAAFYRGGRMPDSDD
ncbi:nitrous oxide reductase accessory protein NosL [Halovivax cerinus]|uniref:Nitrous oxide reductase accessory protein NosL n=1 Tax=Halovivax cerinus TaxID=1487865 RepID=A0ABD5NIU9_9EURY|nr:nitrous oxide reductase accessory protein NosL [Halovivax cerinus]